MEYKSELVKKYLTEVLNIPSPSGYTQNIMEYITGVLKTLNVDYKVTNKGAVVATIKGDDDEYQKTLSCHVDTLGAMVKEVKGNGRLALTQVGGYMMTSVEGECCKIHTRCGKVYEGTIQTIKPSVHIHSDCRELPRVPANYEVVIDEQVCSKEDTQELGIEVGDFISFDPRVKITDSGFVKSRHLDDKASVAAALYVIEYLKLVGIKPKHTVNFFFSNYEEVGHGSSAAVPEKTKEFIAIDMGCPGEGQNSTEYDVCICAKDSGGPYDYELTNRLIQIAKDNNIGYKVDTYPNYGSDAGAMLKAGYDVKTALIGAGIFASHGYERTNLESIIETIKLVTEYVK
ncbi:M42 family metallopeptidase [Paraclostridium bifermentans]|jgi:putative aminopeptidase FrvX|uniref:M42 family metallopeptidase n=1 Tax=Paraclostridium bifermentans TaxID=1490 RepID=UPI000DF7DB68|nr:M42 family metallopeptidase [Paraclostridium bifermentans]MBS5953112.1 M42 family metallopeptidase [Paraclostridium bifermentans]MBU5287375.1 M42 family metallopeptidase [Paraclostridium bifermentans]MDU3336136.1 M42 family metallopeptidase [Paraclostridium bifermentans]RDC49692.1 M20/M25/M40 family metallo-hydrolase [Acinetobacter sp. RIT592]